jgi:hypothetical protein
MELLRVERGCLSNGVERVKGEKEGGAASLDGKVVLNNYSSKVKRKEKGSVSTVLLSQVARIFNPT